MRNAEWTEPASSRMAASGDRTVPVDSALRTPHFMHSALRIPHSVGKGGGVMGYPHKPHARETVLLSKHFGEADARTYKGWVKRGGYEMLAQALTMAPARIIDSVKESGLRGRGGAGFPTRLKWSFMPKEKKKPHYLCVNADESEIGKRRVGKECRSRWSPYH